MKRILESLLVLCLLGIGTAIHAQNGVVITENNGKVVHVNALLELESTTKGFLLPQMTQAQEDALKTSLNALSSADKLEAGGMMVFNSTMNKVRIFDSSAGEFVSVGSGDGGGDVSSITSFVANADENTSGFIKWVNDLDGNGTADDPGWKFVDLATEGINSGDIKDEAIESSDIKDGSITSADIQNGSLQGDDIANNSMITQNFNSSATLESSKSYSLKWVVDAGGVGSWSFIEAESQVLAGAVVTESIADNAVTSPKIKDGEVKSNDIMDAAMKTNHFTSNNSMESGKTYFLKWSGTADNGAWTLEESATSAAPSSVNSSSIEDASIVSADIADNTLLPQNLIGMSGSTSLTTGTLKWDNSSETWSIAKIGEDDIVNGAITTNKIGADAVTSEKIAEESISPTHLSGITGSPTTSGVLKWDNTSGSEKWVVADYNCSLYGAGYKIVTHSGQKYCVKADVNVTNHDKAVTNCAKDGTSLAGYDFTKSINSQLDTPLSNALELWHMSNPVKYDRLPFYRTYIYTLGDTEAPSTDAKLATSNDTKAYVCFAVAVY